MRRSWSLVPALLLTLACDDSSRGPAVDAAAAAAKPAGTPTGTPAAEPVPAAAVSPPSPTPPGPDAPAPPSSPTPPDATNLVADHGDVGRTSEEHRRPVPEPTAAEVLTALDRIADDTPTPPDFSWRLRASALIERDAKLRDQIVDRLIDRKSSHAVREFGVTLLAASGQSDVQAALRRVLDDPGVRADPLYFTLVTRLGFMRHPDADTVAFTQSLRSSDQSIVRHSATMALGRHIAEMHVNKQNKRAAKLAAVLQAALKREKDPGQQGLLLEAIGVGGLPQTRAYIRGFAHSKLPELRGAAAKGMLRDEHPAATALLLKLVVDPDLEVQAVAVDSLVEHELDVTGQRTLHAAILAGRVTPRFDGMLTILVQRRLQGAARKEALEFLLARNPAEDWVRRGIEQALATG